MCLSFDTSPICFYVPSYHQKKYEIVKLRMPFNL